MSRSLDQLQWLQNNARVYMMGLMILTVIFAAAFWFSTEPWQPQTSLSFWDNDSDQAVAEQQIPAKITSDEEDEPIKQIQQQSDLHADTDETITGSKEETNQENQTIIYENDENIQQQVITNEPKTQTVDLLALQEQLSGFTVPCSGELVYGYGVGYDPIYDDYRFHDALCYQAEKAEALAAADGIVQFVDLDEPWQVTLQCGNYQIYYGGLQSCSITAGDSVIGGQSIGIGGKYLMVKAEQ